MNVIFIVPTGLGAPIGGHAGDATPAARLVGSVCDTLIVHPNVVNASDINEMPQNALYVMGVTIDDLLAGYVGLKSIRKNRIAVVVNRPVSNHVVNMVSAARACLGVDAFVVGLPDELRMVAKFNSHGAADGDVFGATGAAEYLQAIEQEFSAVAVLSTVEVSKDVAERYVREVDVNPWGGVEAKLTRILTDALKVPCAHGPLGHTLDEGFDEIVDPRMAAEFVSVTYAFSLLKGLHTAPEITDGNTGIRVDDIDALITPAGCWGLPHRRCVARDIPVIAVSDNTVVAGRREAGRCMTAATYAEAAGILVAIREGISLPSLSRPLENTTVVLP